MKIEFDFSKRLGSKRKIEFAELLKKMQAQIPFRVSSRGWGYLMEQAGYINKAQFDKIEDAINDCRKKGLIPVDFVAEEASRAFSGVEPLDGGSSSMEDILDRMCRDVLDGSQYFQPEWWADEKYYIQVVVEKIDLVTLFEPVCRKYMIPIANSKGWASILQRAEYCKRFKEAEDMGLQCVLLYCGDHDADGLRISDTLRENLRQIAEVRWKDGTEGFDPENLIIDRFGLNYDYIVANNLTWIDNLITGSGKNLADPNHPNHNLDYVQDYLQNVGERKCEANAIVSVYKTARILMEKAIAKYLGDDATERFDKIRAKRRKDYAQVLKESGVGEPIATFLDVHIDDYYSDEKPEDEEEEEPDED